MRPNEIRVWNVAHLLEHISVLDELQEDAVIHYALDASIEIWIVQQVWVISDASH